MVFLDVPVNPSTPLLTGVYAIPAPAWEGRQGAEAPLKLTIPQWIRTPDVNNLFLKIQTSAYTQKYQPPHARSLYANPPPPLRQTQTV